MFGRTWKIATIGGVPIRLDSSLLIIALLVAYSEYVGFTDVVNNVSSTVAIGLAALSTVMFFLSILLHELAHAMAARARSIPVAGITLYMLGGATSVPIEDRGPGDEFLVTAVGPATSFALAGLFSALSHAVGDPFDLVFHYLAFVNFFLAVFNVIPGFPLDGGRILRAVIWRVTGSLERATRVAAGVGMAVGAAFIAIGVVEAVTSGWAPSLWLAFIGWFLLQAARSAIRQQRFRRLLADGVVREAMRPPPRTISPDLSLSAALDGYLRGHENEGFPVVEDGDRVLGVLTFASASRIGKDDPLRPVRDAIVPLPEVMTLPADTRLDRALEELNGRAALVLDHDRLVGAISPMDVNRWLGARAR